MATEDLERRIKICTLCRLHRSRKNSVPGEGPYDAKIVFVGEGPGHMEDLQGVPFAGPLGNFSAIYWRWLGFNGAKSISPMWSNVGPRKIASPSTMKLRPALPTTSKNR